MVVAWRNVDHEWPQSVERSLKAGSKLPVHVLLNFVQWHVPRALDHHLHIVLPGDLGQSAEGFKLSELGLIIGVRQTARPQTVSKREGDVIAGHQLANPLEVRVEEVLFVVGQAPFGHDGATSRHNACDPLRGHRDMLKQHSSVDGEVVDSLLSLLLQDLQEQINVELLDLPVHAFKGLVDRHGPNGNRGVPQDPLSGVMDVRPGGEVHHGVSTPLDRPLKLLHFFCNRRTHRTVSDV